VEAEFISGETKKDVRAAILKSFTRGETRVLVNVSVLLEGYDEPCIKNIILARPTRSPLVYFQQIGRALRIPDKSEIDPVDRERFLTANIIDIADAGRGAKSMNALSLFGVERDMNLEGADVLDAARRANDSMFLASARERIAAQERSVREPRRAKTTRKRASPTEPRVVGEGASAPRVVRKSKKIGTLRIGTRVIEIGDDDENQKRVVTRPTEVLDRGPPRSSMDVPIDHRLLRGPPRNVRDWE